MGDPVDIIKDVGLNFVTGGLYSVAKATKKTVDTGNPMHLLGQGFSVGLAGVGNDLATRIGGPKAGMAFNLAGLGIGLAGGGLTGVASGGFGTAATGGAGGSVITTSAAGVPMVAGAAETAGYVGTTAGSTLAPPMATGGLANLAGLPGGVVDNASGSLSKSVTAGSPGADTAMNELKNMAPALNSTDTAGWFSSLSPGAQTALISGGFAGAQMVTGAMGGLFAGVSAQKKLELEQLINSQTQAQIQYRNKNNQYAPMLKFNHPSSGLINTPAVA